MQVELKTLLSAESRLVGFDAEGLSLAMIPRRLAHKGLLGLGFAPG
jgi:hypothetical protein